VTQRLRELQETTTRAEGQRDLLLKQHEEAKEDLSEATSEVDELGQVLTAFSEVEQAWRRSGEGRIMASISQGLSAVFNDDLQLKIVTKTQRDVSVMELHLIEQGVEIEDIMEGTGGSRVALINMLLNLYLITKLPLERVMVLDEPFASVSPEHIPALGQLLQELRDTLGFQFIIAAHETELQDAADVVIGINYDGKILELKTENEERA